MTLRSINLSDTELIITVLSVISIPLIIYFVKLELRVKGLENDSILAAFKEVQRKQAVEAVEKLLKGWRRKNGKDDD